MGAQSTRPSSVGEQGTIFQRIQDRPRLRDVVASGVRLELVEDKSSKSGGKLVVRGEFGKVGRRTANGRVYGRPLMEREVKKLQADIVARKTYGCCDHPDDAKTKFEDVSHLLTALEIHGDSVMGEAEILNTPKGKILRAVYEAGGAVGVSQRGFGTSERDDDTDDDIVNDDYELVTYDFVAEPAAGTYPEAFTESRGDRPPEARMDLAELKKKHPELVEEVKREILQSQAQERSDKGERGERGELTEARETQQKLIEREKELSGKLQAAQAEVTALRADKAKLVEDADKLAGLSRRAAAKFYLEKKLAGNPDRELIEETIGDVGAYKDLQEMKARADKLVAAFEKRRPSGAGTQGGSKPADERTAKLESLLRESVANGTALALELYTERKLRGNPRAERIRKLVEASKPKSRDDVDDLVEEFSRELGRGARPRDEDEAQAARARARQYTGTRGERETFEEGAGSARRRRSYGDIPSPEEMRQLAGVDSGRSAAQ